MNHCSYLFVIIVYFNFTTYLYAQTLKFKPEQVTIGGRLQGILLHDSTKSGQDLYLRRARINLLYRPSKNHSFHYDLRNDDSNKEDQGEGNFVLGDAYWNININKLTIDNIRLFRAKVDVSHSQTSSSKHLINPERAEVSRYASNFVVHNRRAVNAQINGHLDKLAYHLVISDGVHKDELKDLSGRSIDSVTGQDLTYGAKFRYHLFGDPKDAVQDIYYGHKNVLSIAAAYFTNHNINLNNQTNNSNVTQLTLKRELINLEFSFANEHVRFLTEYFKFEGSLIDLTSANVGSAEGYYAQLHLLYKKWSPYVIYEHFDRYKQESGHLEQRLTLGINYFELDDSRRYGIAYKKIRPEDKLAQLSNPKNDQLYAYVMLHF